MSRKLVIFSGGDRVGKTTLINALQDRLGEENCSVYHHSAPPQDQNNIFDFYRDHIGEWVASDREWCLFDRSYPCSVILESHRRRNNGHLDEAVDFELELLQCAETFRVVHVSVDRPWSFSAKHHLIELKELFPDAAPWFIRDEYVARMREHKHYYEKLYDFYEHTTAFPHLKVTGDMALSQLVDDVEASAKR